MQLRELPSPEECLGTYPSAYWRKLGQAGATTSLFTAWVQGLRRRLWDAELQPLLPFLPTQARVLDLGAGSGDLVAAWLRHGVQAQGIERASEGVMLAQSAGIPLTEGSLDALPPGPWDACCMWHVLEHLPQPVDALKQLSQALAPGTWLFVQVPNAASWQARLFPKRWQAWDAPRHAHHFHPESLARTLTMAGFEVLAMHQPHHRSSRSALVATIWPRLDATAIAALAGPSLNQMAWSIGLFLATLWVAPFTWLESLCGHGATLTLVARKAPSTAPW